MSKVISFTVSENEMQALEAASRREGVDLLKEAAKLFSLGIEADKILHDQTVESLAQQTVESLAQLLHKTRINETDPKQEVMAFEANGAANNASEFQDLVASKDFKSTFKTIVKADKDRAKAMTRSR